MRAITTTVGPVTAADPDSMALSQTLEAAGKITLNGVLATGGVATLDNPRRITITSVGDDSGKTWAVTGTNWHGNVISETIGATSDTVTSVLDYKTVTSISLSVASADAVMAGGDGGATSPWVRFDEWAEGVAGLQFEVSGTVSYSFEASFDDPNDLVNPVAPAAMVWDTSISPVVGATTNLVATLAAAPLWGRINLISGTGSVKGVFLQYLQVPTV